MRQLFLALVLVAAAFTELTVFAAVPMSAPSIAVTPDGRVAILNASTGTLAIATSKGTSLVWKVPYELRASHVVALRRGLLVVCISKQTGRPAMWFVDYTGKKSLVITPKALEEETVTAIANSPVDDSLYVVTARRMLYRMTMKGSEFAVEPPAYLEFTPGAMAVSATGDVAIVDVSNRSLAVFREGGKHPLRIRFLDSVASSIAYSPNGRSILAATANLSGITRFDLSTGTASALPAPGFPPAGVAAGRDGTIWATDPRGVSVVQLGPGGEVVQTRKGS